MCVCVCGKLKTHTRGHTRSGSRLQEYGLLTGGVTLVGVVLTEETADPAESLLIWYNGGGGGGG